VRQPSSSARAQSHAPTSKEQGYAVIEGPIIYDDELGNVDLHHHDLDDYVADLQPVDEEDASAKARQRPPVGPAFGGCITRHPA
jgi:hypothetical protein